MISSKKEISDTDTDSKIRKKSRIKRLFIWLTIDFIIMVTVFILLMYRPGQYNPIVPGPESYESEQISKYWTHELLPKIHNNSQLGRPFDLVITQEGINDIISRANWPVQSEGIMFYSPAALFVPGSVMLMGTADVRGVEFVITIEIVPMINEEGFMNLQVSRMKVGAMNITPIAKAIARKMYSQQVAAFPIDTQDFRAKIVGSLLNDEPFEPVFRIGDNRVRVEKVEIEQSRLTARMVPM
jgi:uncharacterized protein YpmS